MEKAFPIEFVAQTIRQTLEQLHIQNPSLYYGGDNQIAIHSFYEQLQNQEQVDRFVETYRDLADQQNRTGLIGNGIILSNENPSITNIKNDRDIIPLTWTLIMRCTLEDRDTMIGTLNKAIQMLKGRKRDIAELNDGRVFMVGTLGNHWNYSTFFIQNGDFIGEVDSSDENTTIDTQVRTLLTGINWTGIKYLYANDSNDGALCTLYFNGTTWNIIEDDGSYLDVIFAPNDTSYLPYKMSMSFDAIRIDEPKTLNGKEYIEISMGGSATIVSNGIMLGNDLVDLTIQKKKINAATPITFNNDTIYHLDPLEMPSGNNINTMVNQLTSNNFKTNSHADAINLTLQYNFILDTTIPLLKQLFKYGRYGKVGTTVNDISPNMIFEVKEYYSSWGNVETETFKAKIVEDLDIENTESDTMTIGLTMQIQGDND